MKRAAFLATCLLVTPILSATVPVTGHPQDITGSSVASFVRFSLVGCPSPRKLGTNIIVRTSYDFKAAAGSISGSIIPNSEIDCGGSASSGYQVQSFFNNVPSGSPVTYVINGAFNLDSPPTPAVIAPIQSVVMHGFTWKGAWDAGTLYAGYDVVSYAGSSYVALGSSTGAQPDTSIASWQLAASKGNTGATATLASTQTDVTASRNYDTAYHNTTGKLLIVSIQVNLGSTVSASAASDSATTPTTTVAAAGNGITGTTMGFTLAFFVLPGNYYIYRGPTPNVWMEWTIG